MALDPEQERIRQELHFDGIEYVYKAGTSSGSGPSRFDLTEATLALACASKQVDMAVQAKREISRLWEYITKTPYMALFNAGVSGPDLWQNVLVLRAVETALQAVTKKYNGRDALICVHGNRFIAWAAMQVFALKPGEVFSVAAGDVLKVVDSTAAKVIAAFKGVFLESYPASLFKNLTRCKILVAFVK